MKSIERLKPVIAGEAMQGIEKINEIFRKRLQFIHKKLIIYRPVITVKHKEFYVVKSFSTPGVEIQTPRGPLRAGKAKIFHFFLKATTKVNA
jgi:hypothetical protein